MQEKKGREELDELNEQKANFAVVFYGKVSDFLKVKELLNSLPDCRLIYQKNSLRKLLIRESENNGGGRFK